MERHPTVLIPHQVPTERSVDLRTEIEALLGDIDVQITRTPGETLARIGEVEVVVTFDFPAALLEEATELQWIQALSAGIEDYDRSRLRESGVVLTNGSGIHAEPIAEQILGYMLVFERRLHRGLRQQQRRVWERYRGGELRGKTLGIVGVGAIGRRLASVASALGMTVVGTKRDPDEVPPEVDEVFGPDRLHHVLRRSDYVALTCPLTEDTRGLIGAEELGVMPSSAVLVNVARGEIVDEDALTTALQQRRIRGAALDVFEREPLPEDSPLWTLSNVVITPHMAGLTPAYWRRSASIFAENYGHFLDGDYDAMTNRIV